MWLYSFLPLWSTHHSPAPASSPLLWQADRGIGWGGVMELVGELPASHHLASRPARVVGDVVDVREGVGEGEVQRCSTDETPLGLGADSSPPKHFSSHQSHQSGREALQHQLLFLSFVKPFSPGPPLSYSTLFTHSCWANMVSCFINNFWGQSLQ